MADADFRRRWQFFLEHAGYCTPPGRAACALSLARAERDAEFHELAFRWEDDADGWSDIRCDEKRWPGKGPRETCESCGCYDPDGVYLTGLGGIWDADADYRRVIQAQLALEALDELVFTIAETVPQI